LGEQALGQLLGIEDNCCSPRIVHLYASLAAQYAISFSGHN
jgi:hypothetical protein